MRNENSFRIFLFFRGLRVLKVLRDTRVIRDLRVFKVPKKSPSDKLSEGDLTITRYWIRLYPVQALPVRPS